MNKTHKPHAEIQTQEYLWFAQALRGLGALSVVYWHYCVAFLLENRLISEVAQIEPLQQVRLLPHMFWTETLKNMAFESGRVGVAIFFLISGFVVSISLEDRNVPRFIVRRLFRVYPTYAVGLAITCLFIFINATYYGHPFPYSLHDYLVNLSLFRDMSYVPSIDYINWSLEIEIKFYLMCALIAGWAGLDNYKAILVVALILMGINCQAIALPLKYIDAHTWNEHVRIILGYNTIQILFMLNGVALYNLYRKKWSFKKFAWMSAVLTALFLVAGYNRPFPWSFRILVLNYMPALAIVYASYYWREYFPQSRIVDFFAKISYPLYMVHCINGFIIMGFLYKFQNNHYLIMLETLGIVVFIAWCIHNFIETPSYSFGKKITKQAWFVSFFSRQK